MCVFSPEKHYLAQVFCFFFFSLPIFPEARAAWSRGISSPWLTRLSYVLKAAGDLGTIPTLVGSGMVLLAPRVSSTLSPTDRVSLQVLPAEMLRKDALRAFPLSHPLKPKRGASTRKVCTCSPSLPHASVPGQQLVLPGEPHTAGHR